jgi:hypothetical protein
LLYGSAEQMRMFLSPATGSTGGFGAAAIWRRGRTVVVEGCLLGAWLNQRLKVGDESSGCGARSRFRLHLGISYKLSRAYESILCVWRRDLI